MTEEEVTKILDNELYIIEKFVTPTNPYTGVAEIVGRWYRKDVTTIKDLLGIQRTLMTKGNSNIKKNNITNEENGSFTIETNNIIIDYRVSIAKQFRMSNIT